eukprot:Stramenopile-MAST_4_protein_192
MYLSVGKAKKPATRFRLPASNASEVSTLLGSANEVIDSDKMIADTENKPASLDNKLPSLLSLSIDVVVSLIVTDTTRLMLTRIVQQLPIGIASLILTELPPDLLFQYYVICNADHFQALNWREFWSLQYARSLSKRKQENEELVEPVGSWDTKASTPMLPRSLNGFYKDLENNSRVYFETVYSALVKMVAIMRKTRNKNGQSSTKKAKTAKALKKKGRNKAVALPPVRVRKKNKSPCFSGTAERLIPSPMKTAEAARVNAAQRNTKARKSAAVDWEFMVPQVFGCDAVSTSLDFFFPYSHVLATLWPMSVRPTFMAPLIKLSLRGAMLDDDIVRRVCAQHPQLEVLDLASQQCRCIDGLSTLGSLSTLKHLKTLNLGHWGESLLNDSTLALFLSNISKRKHVLSPRDSSAATSTSRQLRALLPVFSPVLENLCLESCSGITDAGINKLLLAVPGLRDLSLCGCYHLTDDCAFGFGNPDLRLKRLNYSGAYKVSDWGFLRPLLSVHPDIILYNNPNEFGLD